MITDAEAERTRALMLLLATLDTVAQRLDEERLEDLGLIARITELETMLRHDLEQVRAERNPPPAP